MVCLCQGKEARIHPVSETIDTHTHTMFYKEHTLCQQSKWSHIPIGLSYLFFPITRSMWTFLSQNHMAKCCHLALDGSIKYSLEEEFGKIIRLNLILPRCNHDRTNLSFTFFTIFILIYCQDCWLHSLGYKVFLESSLNIQVLISNGVLNLFPLTGRNFRHVCNWTNGV